jgi:hypothetical protein
MAKSGDLADAPCTFDELQTLMERLMPALAAAVPQSPTLSTAT